MGNSFFYSFRDLFKIEIKIETAVVGPLTYSIMFLVSAKLVYKIVKIKSLFCYLFSEVYLLHQVIVKS